VSQPLKIAATESVSATLDQFAQLIHERAGLRFSDRTRRRSLLARVGDTANEVGCSSIQELYARVVAERSAGAPCGTGLFQKVLDRIVTDETSFFRYAGHFEALRSYIFPAIASNREFSGDNSLRILSAGCSRGQEPYSVAISVLEEAETLRGLDTRIYALDLSQNVLDIARKGVYDMAQVRDVEPRLLEKHFDRIEGLGNRPPSWRVKPQARSLVRFQRHNLLKELPGPIFDVIFCRNVTIYFDDEVTRRVARNLYDRLRPGGYLFLGHAESLYNILPELCPLRYGETLVNRKPSK
jgi:chemotaxis protein methyltransferase CheR